MRTDRIFGGTMPVKDPIFDRAVVLLAHPISIAALALLVLNDQVFKRLSPSWLTGKLSDFAAVFLMPFLLAAFLAWLIPSTVWRRESVVQWLSFLLTGIPFALVKAVPIFHNFLTQFLPVRALLDPSDLLALIALPAGWMLWEMAPAKPIRYGRLVIPLAALFLLADAAAPDTGIACVSVREDHMLMAGSSFNRVYLSSDGGLSWQTYTGVQAVMADCSTRKTTEAIMTDPNGPVRYRFTPGVSIERSADGGQTWQVDYPLTLPNEVQRAYAGKMLPSNIAMQPGPLDAVQDPATGNVIFAMGVEGVLVRESSGKWIWVAIGQNDHALVSQIPLGGYFTLLFGEVILAFIAALLAFSTLGLRLQHHWWQVTKVVVGWLGWLVCVGIFPPAISNGSYGPLLSFMSLGVIGIWALLSFVIDLFVLVRLHPRRIFPMLGTALVVAILFLVPYLLWAFRILPAYSLAAIVAVVLAAVFSAAGLIRIRPTA